MQLAEARELAGSGDAEMKALAEEEIARARTRTAALEQEIQVLLVPKDPNDDRNVVLEIRARHRRRRSGAVRVDLFRMYSRYAERRGWKIDVLSMQRDRRRRPQGSHRHRSKARAFTAG